MPLTAGLLSGAWSLRSFVLDNGEDPPRAWAHKVSGLLVYHPDGFMAVSIDGWARRVAEDQVCTKKFSYAGRFEIEKESQTVVHIVTHASDQTRVGQRLRRHATLQDGMLTLISDSAKETATLIWGRIQ